MVKVKIIQHWVKSIVGLEGVLTGKETEYNGNVFYEIEATNNGEYIKTGSKTKKVRAWKIGDKLSVKKESYLVIHNHPLT